MRRYNLAYLFLPKAGSSTMKNTLRRAGKTEQVWLSPPNNETSTLDPFIFTLMRDPGERVVSAYSTILARYNGRFSGGSSNKFPEPPGNTTDAAMPAWKEHFQTSIAMMMRTVKEAGGWNSTRLGWNVHIVPQVEFMRGLNVSHIGCVESINETLTKLDLVDAGNKVKRNHYEHNAKMPSKKVGSYAMLSIETKKMIREVYDEDYVLFESLCTNK